MVATYEINRKFFITVASNAKNSTNSSVTEKSLAPIIKEIKSALPHFQINPGIWAKLKER